MSARAKKKHRGFGPTAPPFLDYLKDILRRYPDGGQILKELIQNADDANATEVKFIHDDRSYGTQSLCNQHLAKYQGPALYAFNNAEFTDEDWEGIQNVARSVKRDDPNKVGRFGLGFNSVYHITDLTSILSAGHLGMMDPQEQVFGAKTGKLWSLDDEDHQQEFTTMQDQFQPFQDIVALVSEQEWTQIIQEQHFNGTLFRFPLRTEASDISDNLYSHERVDELFGSFFADAELSLLFLKNVSSVSLMHIDAEGSIKTLLEVKSASSPSYNLESYEGVTEGYTDIKSITLSSDELKETKWLVTSCTLTEGNVDRLDDLAGKLKFVPRIDLAFPCTDHNDCSRSRLCCFLPLPNNDSNKTGLPVFVNAYFGLTDNRRHIKWQEEDQMNDEHAIWNELLIKEVLPETYLTILRDAIKLVQDDVLPASSIYNLWPDLAQVQHKERWHEVALDVLRQLFEQNIAVLSLAKDERRFIKLSEAVFPCNGPTNPDTLDAIKRVLVSRDENLVTLSDSVTRALETACPDFSSLTHVTPAFLRGVLQEGVQDISDEDRRTLLEYVLIDEQYEELNSLQLLPVSDGSFKYFTDSQDDTALIDSDTFPRTLLPFCQSLFIPDDLSPECVDHLRQLSDQDLFMVINIDKDQVLRWTKSHLPEDWKKTEETLVTWEMSSAHHPPRNWLPEFWRFLDSHFEELSCCTGLPLIPVNIMSNSQQVTLAKIQQHPTLIFEKSKQVVLPENIAQLVNKVGGTVVKENNWLKHEDLDSYVLSPSPQHVLQVLMNLQSQTIINQLLIMPKILLEELKRYLSRLEDLSNREIELLLQLPLFQNMLGEYTSAKSKCAVLFISGLTIPLDLPMPETVVRCATEADRKLLQLLNVQPLETAQAASLLIDSVENIAIGKTDIDKIMTWILENGNVLFSQNPNLKKRCTELSFIEIDGTLKKTSSLYDPRVKSFKVLFEDDFFPPTMYTKTQQMLTSLIDLGLVHKAEKLSPEHLLHAASLVQKRAVCDHKEALEKAHMLLKILDSYDLLNNFNLNQIEQLKNLKWISVTKPKTSKQKDHLQSGFFCPGEMRHSMYEDIVGYVMPLEGSLSENLCKILGLKQPPPNEKVVENLSVLISKAKDLESPDTDVDFKRKLRSTYEHMQKSINDYVTIISKDTRWLWNRSQFVAPKDLVLNFPSNLDLSSHIGKVTSEFLPYKKLFVEFGLRDELTIYEIIGLLYTIKQTVEGRDEAIATSSEVKVSIDILNWLFRERKQVVPDDIPVPVIVQLGHYTLKPKSLCVFCDLSKNGLKELECNQEEIHVVHEEMPIATAEWLNIQLLSTLILDPMSVGIEQCGQMEPITTRIKNILKEYDEESDLFKEIIQNAEDAGAQTCKFLLDFRVHNDDPESLIDPDMKLCQGPCVWAFNNEQFSPDDWDNIVKVGSASKEDMVEKIGMFGLGFNTVYHVTDIPSILSGSTLLILDPNITHLKKRIKHKSNPGIKVKLSHQRLKWFPGQFAPYEGVFNCDFSGKSPKHYPGTLIKLPFRTEEESRLSEISSKVYNNKDIVAFQRQFTQDAQSHLIFLKNITTVSLQTASSSALTPLTKGDIEDVFRVSKSTLCRMDIPEEDPVLKRQDAEKLLLQVNKKYKEVIDCSKVDIVEITCQQPAETQVQCWLLRSSFGTNESLKLAMEKNKKVAFSLPVGAVAVPLQFNHEAKSFQVSQTELAGKAFCFLPLSIDTGLPFNVNGTFAVTSNRKALWGTGIKHEWNKSLLQDPILSAFITALLALKKMSQNNKLENYCYHTFWPQRELVSEHFRPLVDAFYCAIAQTGGALKLFSDGDKWFSLKNAIFLEESIQEDQIFSLVMQVCQKHVKPGHVVTLPSWIRTNFKQAGVEKVLEDQTWTWGKFYKDAVFPNLDKMDPKCRDFLMLHAIHLNMKDIDCLLIAHPCIPSTSGKLQYIKNLVIPNGKVTCLFEPEESRMLGGSVNDFCSTESIFRLQMLGIKSENISFEDITRKAKEMSNVWAKDKNKAYKRIQCLLGLLKLHLDNDLSPFWEALRETPFLPAFKPGDAEMEGEVILQRPAYVFSKKCASLVNMTQTVLETSKLGIFPSDPVLQMLGVHDHPEVEMVLEQLKEANTQCQFLDKLVLNKMVNECYKFLDRHLCDSKDDVRNLLECANSFTFVLVGDTFVNINCVAETAQFDAKPYLYALPHQFAHYRTLWETVGMKKEFTLNQCVQALKDIKSKHRNEPLPTSDLSICFTILNKGIYETAKTTESCLVPNEKGILKPAQSLFYNDSPWIPVKKSVQFCHENISRVMAMHLGIKTTRHHTLISNVVENMSPFAFQFEQKEQLTTRIRNIISAYPAKKDILKELIQNADDADATEINFVWDKRKHSHQKTFGDKWNNLQGPALCVFNNKVFSDADLKGIQDLGEGGKHNSPGKTGKYGLGFNSVYHLTDCPSILTGDELLCISDPNQNYIESTSDVSPAGIGFNLVDTFKNMYRDVYNSFLPDKFSLKEGTMFRLPLRTDAMANSSNISCEAVSEDDMKELCAALSEEPDGLILFLKSIRKICVYEIDQTTELKLIYSVEKNITESSIKKKKAFDESKECALRSDTPVDQKVVFGTVISTSQKGKTTWTVGERFVRTTDDKQKMAPGKLAQAAVAARVSLKNEPKSQTNFKGEAFCSLPLPGHTGLPVHVNANFEVDSSRRDLWKEDGQSPKIQWNKYLKQSVIAPLYADLLNHRRSELRDKEGYKTKLKTFIDEYYLCLFPIVLEDIHPDWHDMVKEVYRSIKERSLDMIPVYKGSTRATTANGPTSELKVYSFDWSNITETEPTKTPYLTKGSEVIITILEDVEMRLVPSNMEKVWRSFKLAGIKLHYVTPSTVQTFLRAKPLNDPSQTEKQLPLPVSQTQIKNNKKCAKLLNFCLKDLNALNTKDKEVDPSVIDGLPLLLTKDKVLRSFNRDSPMFACVYDQLFINYEDQLVDFQTNEKCIPTLEKFGFVKRLTILNSSDYLKTIIQDHLQRCNVDQSKTKYVPSKEILLWLKNLWKFISSELSTFTKDLTLADVRQLYNECCIFPVICPQNKQKYLEIMKHMPSVIMFSSDESLSKTLFQLGFMKLDNCFFSEMNLELRSQLRSELLDVNNHNSVLDQLYNQNCLDFSHLSSDEMTELQTFLCVGVSKAKNKDDYLRKFQSLPLFETINSERVRIDQKGFRNVYVLDMNEMKRFPSLFGLPETSAIFLKNSSENIQLSCALGIKKLSDRDFFVQFLVPVVHKLTESQILDCLKLYLSLHSNLEDGIISAFRNVKLIRSSFGKLQLASYFYDEAVEIFKVMLPEERFVPKTFLNEVTERNEKRVDDLKRLLKELGMKHAVSADDIITFAHQVEGEVKNHKKTDDLKRKSEIIFKNALGLAKDTESQEGQLLQTIAHVRFVFPVKIKTDLCNYHPSFISENIAVPISGALIEGAEQTQDLIWSSMAIIDVPVYKSKKVQQALLSAGAFEKPPSEYVIKNLKNICLSPCKNKETIQTRARVFRTSYAFLENPSIKSKSLAGHPIVLVEKCKKLITTDDVCFSLHCDKDFRPYLYQIPADLIIYTVFFRNIGVREKPSAVQIGNVLAAVYGETCNKPSLQPNQLKTVQRAVQQLFQIVKEQKQCLDDIKVLYLPGVCDKLMESHKLYYNDTHFEASRLERALPERFVLLRKLSECHLKADMYEHQKLLKQLPQRLQPQMLSQITEEKLVETQMEFCDRNCHFREFFEDHLSSIVFEHALICLIRSELNGKVTQDEALEMCNTTFGRIQIVCRQSLQTELWLENQQLPNTAAKTEVYVKKDQQGCTFYLQHNDMDNVVLNYVCQTLVTEINSLLGNILQWETLMACSSLLLCDNLEQVRKMLANYNICDSVDVESIHKLPAPGTEIPSEWYDALDLSFLNNFEVGEYVGYDSNGKYIYAVIVEELRGDAVHLRQRYKIDIGEEEPIEASFLDLYQFKRESPPTHSSSQELQVVEGAVPHSSQQNTRSSPASVKEAKKEIDKSLDEVWTLHPEERQKAIKRLYLRWHPDKNPDCPTLATEAFKYLQQRIEELSCKRTSTGQRSSSSSSAYSGTYTNFRNFFHEWDEEARYHRTSRERFHTGRRSYNFWAYNDNIPQPNKEEAKRWLRQAQCDLHAAENDIGNKATEWCLFKVHQAVEKALTAASYRNNGKRPKCSSILATASKVSCYSPFLRNLPQLVRELVDLGVDPKKTQYPDCHTFPQIPNGQFKSEYEICARDQATQILAQVDAYVNH